METELGRLEAINLAIGDAESDGNREYFEDLLAASFAFRRASGVIADRSQFIDAVSPGHRRVTMLRSITTLGRSRAIVACVVTVTEGGSQVAYDNLRVFVRSDDGRWQLLAWANERLSGVLRDAGAKLGERLA